MRLRKKKNVSPNFEDRLDMLSQIAMSGVKITIEKVMERLGTDEKEAIRIVREVFVKSDSEAEIR